MASMNYYIEHHVDLMWDVTNLWKGQFKFDTNFDFTNDMLEEDRTYEEKRKFGVNAYNTELYYYNEERDRFDRALPTHVVSSYHLRQGDFENLDDPIEINGPSLPVLSHPNGLFVQAHFSEYYSNIPCELEQGNFHIDPTNGMLHVKINGETRRFEPDENEYSGELYSCKATFGSLNSPLMLAEL